jgi:hypothetical protein
LSPTLLPPKPTLDTSGNDQKATTKKTLACSFQAILLLPVGLVLILEVDSSTQGIDFSRKRHDSDSAQLAGLGKGNFQLSLTGACREGRP